MPTPARERRAHREAGERHRRAQQPHCRLFIPPCLEHQPDQIVAEAPAGDPERVAKGRARRPGADERRSASTRQYLR